MTPLFAALGAFRAPNVFNPWADRDALDLGRGSRAAAERRARLAAHFAVRPLLVLVGEAAGYQGCRYSGIPFTHERLLLEQRVPRVAVPGRICRRERPWSEPSATVVWATLHALGIAERVVLWNAFAWHPHRPGEPLSNRAPTTAELEAGRPVLEAVLAQFAPAAVVAVGRVAERALGTLGRTPAAALRHPSMGGAKQFRAGLAALAARLPVRRRR